MKDRQNLNKRPLRACALSLIVILVLSSVAAAAPASPAPLLDDAAVIKSLPGNNYGTLAFLDVMGSTGPGGSCDGAVISYLKFNLGGLGVISSATFTVSTSPGSSGSAMTMGLWGASTTDTTGWSEGTVTYGTAPTLDTDLASTAAFASTGTIVFNSSTALVGFLNTRRLTTDHTATIAIIPVTCSGTVEQLLKSKEAGAGGPVLDVTAGPLAATLSTFRADDPATNWPLILAAGVLGLALAVTLIVYRKRAAVRA